MEPGKSLVLEAADLDHLIQAVIAEGYQLIGPKERERTLIYDALTTANELPRGWKDRQEKGSYRLEKTNDPTFFGFASTLQAWKKFLHPPRRKLWDVIQTDAGMVVQAPELGEEAPMAFLGVRSCDLHAIAAQDRVFTKDKNSDKDYAARREGVLMIAVNCTAEAATCFCTAMGTGPAVSLPHDLVMTEILDRDEHFFLLGWGSDRGKRILDRLPLTQASDARIRKAQTALDDTAARIDRNPRAIETADIQELLYRNYNSPHWDEVGERCLSCANCTMVCPTCFCSSVEDVTDVDGKHAQRWERWDSCFTQDFSYLHGGAVRESVSSRYRQWMTHKLATWIDQFGSSGCVGCGRCIAWCPVGIDITEEVAAIRVREMSND